MVRVKRRASKETRQPVELAEAIRRSLSTEKITQRPPMARIKKTHLRRANVVPVDRRRDWPVESNNINNINAGYWEKAFISFLIEKKVRINFKTPNPKINQKKETIYEEFMHCKTMDQLKNYGVPEIRHDIRFGYLVIHKDDLRKRWDEYKDDDDNVPDEKFKKQATDASVIIATLGEWPRGRNPVKGFPYGPFLATDAQKKASYPYENEEDDEEEPAPAPDDEDDDEDYSENIQAPDPAPDDDEDEDDYEEDDDEPAEPAPPDEEPAPDDDDDDDAAQNALKRKRKIEEIQKDILEPESKELRACFEEYLYKGELSWDDFIKRGDKYEQAKKQAKEQANKFLEIALA
tara:strand:+ start:258 stop:1301 length:1044 start_codon:yes stop_codon:yes gene_type:complete